MKILIRFLVIAVALAVAAWLVPGIRLTGHNDTTKVETLLIVAVIFGLINVLIKPIIKTVGCAFYVLTLGLFALVVNGALLLLTSWIAYDKLHEPFHVLNFGSAVVGALIVSVISWVAHLVIPDDGDRR
ncbi:MAG: phage holin family protein [Trebonia sp.]|jgi:putative membrane protein